MKVFHSENVFYNKKFQNLFIVTENGKIIDVVKEKPQNKNFDFFDFDKLFIMPGFIDSHVHINEPGRNEWEGIETGTKACSFAGITSLVDMPLNNSPVTLSKKDFELKMKAYTNRSHVDFGFYGGIVPNNLDHIEELKNCGVLGFKSFMIDSGLPDFLPVSESDIRKAVLKIKDPLPYLLHAEVDLSLNSKVSDFASFLKSRPREMENKAIKMLMRISEDVGFDFHIVHLSSSDLLEELKAFRINHNLTIETCPHYLTLSSEEIADQAVEFKSCPPIREKENQDKLWKALKEGVIDYIVSDHSPCSPDLKEGGFNAAWGGISSLQFGPSLIWSKMKEKNIPLNFLPLWMSENIAHILKMGKKGMIEMGRDADLVVFDPEKSFVITEELIQYKHKISPYLGKKVFGSTEATILRGEFIFQNGKVVNNHLGKAILRNEN